MLLAINYSQAAARLVRSGQIEIDAFKTPDWDWMVSEAVRLKPVAVHFNLEAGNNSLGEVDWEKVDRLAQHTQTPNVNLHMDARQNYYPELAVDTRRALEVEEIAATITSDVLKVVKRYGPERVIIENSPYRAEEGNTMRLNVVPEFIAQVVEDTGCGLLLDVSHAILTAHTLGMAPDEYMGQLPVKKIKEMHFAGIDKNLITGVWTDHLSIQEEDWYWLDWVLERIRTGEWNAPWLLAFEYGGVGEPFEWRSDPQVMAEQVPELRQRLSALAV